MSLTTIRGQKRITINGELVEIERTGDYFDQIEYDVGREVLGEHEHEVLLARRRTERRRTLCRARAKVFCNG